MNKFPNDVWIFDTTLRDGEQSPGATMNTEEKLLVARQIEQLGVNVIEAGFAAASPDDAHAIASIAKEITQPIVLSLSRTREADIVAALKAVEKAKRAGIHLFIATSDLHLDKKLMISRQEAIDAACWAIERARKYVDYVEFSAEDASRSDREYLVQFFTEVIRCGANTVNVPDTTGYATVQEFGDLFAYLIKHTPNSYSVRWSAHCHDDLGLSVANSLAAVSNGARQIECTINGIGERAGNTSLEEVVMALKTRVDQFKLSTSIDTRLLYPTSRLVSHVTGIIVPPNKAIVGDNAFAHEAGIHQDGVMKDRTTYEIMRPEDVGLPANKIVLGKHSSRKALVTRLRELGVDISKIDTNTIFTKFKNLCDRKKHVYDEDLIAIVTEQALSSENNRFQLVNIDARSASKPLAKATVELLVDGKKHKATSQQGNGIVDMCFDAIDQIIGIKVELVRYGIASITGGLDAQGEVTCLIRQNGATVSGLGADTDIVKASALAYINAFNKLVHHPNFKA